LNRGQVGHREGRLGSKFGSVSSLKIVHNSLTKLVLLCQKFARQCNFYFWNILFTFPVCIEAFSNFLPSMGYIGKDALIDPASG